jgi:hypothetical protein
MKQRCGLLAVLAALTPFAAACNSILGIKERPPAVGGSGGGGGTGGSGGATGTGGAAGTSSGCGVDGAADDAGAMDAGAGTTCGFTMPNPASAGLPNPASYTVNTADGTVTDNVTHLTWEGTAGFTVYMQAQASRPCDQKGGGWRLPTRVELVSLVDSTVAKPGPAVNAVFASDPIWVNSPGPDDKKFWTSSHAACSTSIGWYVDFANGSTHQANATSAYKVRCVRGQPSNCSPTRYQEQSDGTMTDVFTGLTWQRDVNAQQAWNDATGYCPALGTGWRLPSLTELQTIIDETKQNPAIDGDAFPQTPAMGYFWTSVAQAGDPDYAWYVTVVHGHADVEQVGTAYWVRCVR